jgi:hypothetical protein
VNWEAISAIGQIVGALAVVISLIYLARKSAAMLAQRDMLRWRPSFGILDNSSGIRT